MTHQRAETQRPVDVFVAGVCDGDRGPGGWGAVLRYGERICELNGAELAPTTADRMLSTAAAEALDRLTRPALVHLHADHAAARSHADLQPRLVAAARRHRVRWTRPAGSGEEYDRASGLAQTGLLDATRRLDSRCVHDLITRQCWQCRPSASRLPARVAVTAGGAVFHLSEGCSALHEGWRSVERRGGTRSDVAWMPIVDALAAGRGACEVCSAGRALR